MKRMLYAGLLFAAALSLTASSASADGLFGLFGGEKGSGDLVTETRDVDEFDRVSLEGSMDVFITIGEPRNVSVIIDDNLQDNITTRVTGRGTLHIETDDIRRTHRDSRVEITVPQLARVTIEGSGDIDVVGLDGDDLGVYVDGSGDIDLSGEVRRLDVYINGSGDVDAEGLVAEDVDVDINGSGDVSVYASRGFSGSVHGSGDIHVYGDPDSFSQSVAGSGDIVRR